MTPRHCPPGFTLIEILIVLAIISLMLGFGFLGLFSWIGEDHVRTTDQALRAEIQMAMALGLQNPSGVGSYSVVDDTAHSRLLVCPGTSGTPCNDPAHAAPLPKTSTITLNGTAFTCIAFDDHGLPTSSTGCPLVAPQSGQWVFTIQDVSNAHTTYTL